MEEKRYIPFIAHEADMTRLERMIERLWITILTVLGLLVGSNIFWIIRYF